MVGNLTKGAIALGFASLAAACTGSGSEYDRRPSGEPDIVVVPTGNEFPFVGQAYTICKSVEGSASREGVSLLLRDPEIGGYNQTTSGQPIINNSIVLNASANGRSLNANDATAYTPTVPAGQVTDAAGNRLTQSAAFQRDAQILAACEAQIRPILQANAPGMILQLHR